METQTNSLLLNNHQIKPVTVFGYSSKSLPGLEIHGLGKYGKTLKEKIIYLTKSRQLSVSLKRFVIVADESEIDSENCKWLDLPILLIYWQLAQIVPLKKLDNCLILGQVTPSGEITLPQDNFLNMYAQKNDLIFLSRPENNWGEVSLIDVTELLSHIPLLKWKGSQLNLQSQSSKNRFSLNTSLNLPDKPFLAERQ